MFWFMCSVVVDESGSCFGSCVRLYLMSLVHVLVHVFGCSRCVWFMFWFMCSVVLDESDSCFWFMCSVVLDESGSCFGSCVRL